MKVKHGRFGGCADERRNRKSNTRPRSDPYREHDRHRIDRKTNKPDWLVPGGLRHGYKPIFMPGSGYKPNISKKRRKAQCPERKRQQSRR